jgi:hypothetical protein
MRILGTRRDAVGQPVAQQSRARPVIFHKILLSDIAARRW